MHLQPQCTIHGVQEPAECHKFHITHKLHIISFILLANKFHITHIHECYVTHTLHTTVVSRDAPYTTFKLDSLSSSPLHDYYVGRRLVITGGPSEGSFGTGVIYMYVRICVCVCVCVSVCLCMCKHTCTHTHKHPYANTYTH